MNTFLKRFLKALGLYKPHHDYLSSIEGMTWGDRITLTWAISPELLDAGYYPLLAGALQEWEPTLKQVGLYVVSAAVPGKTEPELFTVADIQVVMGDAGLEQGHNAWTHTDTHVSASGKGIITRAVITLDTSIASPLNRRTRSTDAEVRRVVMHELGHALGIEGDPATGKSGHSPDDDDAMFSPVKADHVSAADRNTLVAIYAKSGKG